MPTDPMFWTIAVLAVIFVGLSKSGLIAALGMIGVPLLTLVMPAREAAGMMLPILLAMDAFAVWSYRRELDWSVLRIMLPGAIVGIGVGWALSSIVSDDWVMLVLGLITVLFVLDAWLPLRKKLQSDEASQKRSPVAGNFWGSLSGFTSFVSHSGGPPYQIYTLPMKLEPRIYAGTSAWFFAIVNIIKLVPYFFLGQINVSSLQASAALAPIGIAAVLVGIWLTRRISMNLFYTFAYIGILLIGMKLVWDGAAALFFVP